MEAMDGLIEALDGLLTVSRSLRATCLGDEGELSCRQRDAEEALEKARGPSHAAETRTPSHLKHQTLDEVKRTIREEVAGLEKSITLFGATESSCAVSFVEQLNVQMRTYQTVLCWLADLEYVAETGRKERMKPTPQPTTEGENHDR